METCTTKLFQTLLYKNIYILKIYGQPENMKDGVNRDWDSAM